MRPVPRLARLPIGAVSARASSIAAAFGLSLAVARFTSRETAGQYFVYMAVIVAAATVGRFGSDTLALKQVASHAISGADIGRLVGLVTAGSVVAGGVASGFILHVARDGANGMTTAIVAATVVATAGSAMAVLAGAVLRGAGQIASGMFIEAGAVPTAALIVTVAGHEDIDFPNLVRGYAIACAIAGVFGLVLMARACSSRTAAEAPLNLRSRATIASMASMAIAAAVFYLLTWAPVLILGWAGLASQAAIYSAAARLAGFVNLVPAMQNSYIAPEIARAYYRGDVSKVSMTCRSAARRAITVAVPFVLVYTAFPAVAEQIFGAAYAESRTPLVILAAAFGITIALGPVNAVLMTCGGEHLASALNILLLATTGIALLLVVDEFGATGAALVAGCGSVIYAAIAAAAIKSAKSIRTTI